MIIIAAGEVVAVLVIIGFVGGYIFAFTDRGQRIRRFFERHT